jgi:CreA protein
MKSAIKYKLMGRALVLLCALIFLSLPALADDKTVAKLSTDIIGNAVEVEAIDDPKVTGVTCYWSHFNRSLIDRLWKMKETSVFLDPSNSGLDCHRTADDVTIGKIDLGKGGEEIGHEKISLFFRNLKIVRIYDAAHNTLVYVSYSTRITEGSAKSAVSAVPLTGVHAVWTDGEPTR